MKAIQFVIIFLFPFALQAQIIEGLGTKWNDEFKEWIIYLEEDDELEELEGELNMKWQMQEDWTAWDYWVGDHSGTIKVKWRNNPNEWELRGDGQLVTAKMLWRDDPREWRITNNTQTLTFKSKYGNQLNEWELRDDRHGEFAVFTRYENDPREWDVYDDMDRDISFNMKLMMVFIAIYYGTPRL